MKTITFHPDTSRPGTKESSRLGSIDPRLSRTNYFDGQLLKASDLTRDQIYLDERLLELGQVLGSGIAQGLEVELVNNHILQVSPGIAIAPSGRVLQFSDRRHKPLQINLQDSGVIADLNSGHYRRFNRGLYAVALCYAEVVDGISEAYPADLSQHRAMQVSSYAEGVELALIPLNLTLPHGDEITIRAALERQLISHDSNIHLPNNEAVALGLIAIENARPLWLDHGLLRRPLRRPNTPNAQQLDLASHYRELFQDVLAIRQQSGRHDNLLASNYFQLLPPFGPIPKGAIDPVNGSQSFFPEDYEVAIAPVRRADIPAIIEESAHLAPLDLKRDADADIMVLVPMSDQAFALRARQLEKVPAQNTTVIHKLPYLNSLARRLFTPPAVHHIDTDRAAWSAIWENANPNELIYVRRPPRTAETNVSAVILARGFELPPLAKELPPDPASLEKRLDDALEQNHTLNNTLGKKDQEVAALKQEINALQDTLNSNTALADALARTEDLEKELHITEAEISNLNKTITDLQSSEEATDAATQQKINELTSNLNAANNKVTALSKERETLERRLQAGDKECQDLQNEIEQLNNKIARLSANSGNNELANAQVEIRNLKQQLAAQNKELQSLRNDLAQSKTTNDNLNLELQKRQTQIASLQKELERMRRTTAASTPTTIFGATRFPTASFAAQAFSLKTEFQLTSLASMRRANATAATKLEAIIGDNNKARQAVIEILTMVPSNYDRALWPSLVTVAKNLNNLTLLSDNLAKITSKGGAIPNAIPSLDLSLKLGLTAADKRNWAALVR